MPYTQPVPNPAARALLPDYLPQTPSGPTLEGGPTETKLPRPRNDYEEPRCRPEQTARRDITCETGGKSDFKSTDPHHQPRCQGGGTEISQRSQEGGPHTTGGELRVQESGIRTIKAAKKLSDSTLCRNERAQAPEVPKLDGESHETRLFREHVMDSTNKTTQAPYASTEDRTTHDGALVDRGGEEHPTTAGQGRTAVFSLLRFNLPLPLSVFFFPMQDGSGRRETERSQVSIEGVTTVTPRAYPSTNTHWQEIERGGFS